MSLSGKIFGKRRGPTQEEIIRETNLKKKISSELSSAIKALQQEHCNTGESILSTDSANHVCNVIEAAFLHGLKNSVARKIGKYVGLQNGENADHSVNFWNFASKFTHKDTTAQLTRLGQITTEIGLCRAWTRVALNDGLITSYVDAMLVDKRTLQYFYHRLAYLMDFDQQEIFKSLLKGLMVLEFKLSYNSRVLNVWTNTPLVLAGIIERDNTPLPVVQTSGKGESNQDTALEREKEEVKVIRTNSKSGSANEPKTPPNTPFNSGIFTQGFTRQDLENFKNFNLSSSPHDTECSSSSHISCPDPVKYNKNPAAYVESDNKDDVMFTLNEENDHVQDMYVSEDIEVAIRRSNAQKTESPSENVLSWNSPDNFDFNKRTSENAFSSENARHPVKFDIDSAKNSPDLNLLNDSSCENITDENRTCDYSREDYHARILADILGEGNHFDSVNHSSPDQSDSGIVNSPSFNSPSENTIPSNSGVKIRGKKHNLKPDFSAKHESAPPEISPAVASSIETSKIKFSKHRHSLPNIRVLRNSPQNSGQTIGTITEIHAPSTRPRSESDKADETIVSPSSVGNSLGAVSGWSSSFNLEAQDTVEPLPEPKENIPGRPKAESFGSLLKNYTPTSSVTSPTIDDVVHDLPGSSDLSSPPQHRIYDMEDDTVLIEGYEIAPSLSDAVTQSKLSLFGEIANEKGLDAQNYQCKGCTRPVGLIYGKPRVCTFDGGYYCFECHENDVYYIPAMVVHNWDFRKHPVAKCNQKFLQDTEDQAKIDISKINPKLYDHVKEMADLKVLRKQLYFLRTYLFTCKQSIADEFRQTLWPREYLYENIHIYSLSDFLQVPSGTLAQSLKKVIKFATKHVYECRLCSQKGYICELCNQPKVIYPFELDSTVRCKQCKSVFHKMCKTEGKQCPKCLRKQQRRSQMGNEPETPDSQDYAYVPLQ